MGCRGTGTGGDRERRQPEKRAPPPSWAPPDHLYSSIPLESLRFCGKVQGCEPTFSGKPRKIIDWKNLEALPTKRRDRDDRERLAVASFTKKCAHHKGRAHWYSWQQRQRANAAAFGRRKADGVKASARSRFLAQARAYWAGEIDEHS